MQFLVIMRTGDIKDPELQRKRAELRAEHLKRAASFRDRGHVIIGGAILSEDGTPTGSAAIAEFETRAEVDAWLADDPWTKAGVWRDFEIIPFRISENYPQGRR